MNEKIRNCLFFLRLSIFLVFVMWTIDKFVNAEHAVAVYQHFYFIGGINANSMVIIGIAELILICLFVAGRFKNVTYLIVLLMHAVSTLSSFRIYLDPFAEGQANLLFFTAWPMLAAGYMLYAFRHEDTKFNL